LSAKLAPVDASRKLWTPPVAWFGGFVATLRVGVGSLA
jgi:hypothetical protein